VWRVLHYLNLEYTQNHENHANALMRVVEKCEVRLFNLSQLLKTIKNNLKS
jgi:hypothetical protein